MYEYESGTIPQLPTDFNPSDTDTDVSLLQQIIKNQEFEMVQKDYQLQRYEEEVKTLKDSNTAEHNDNVQLHNDNTLLNQKLDTLIDQGSTGNSSLSDSNTQILQKLDNLNTSITDSNTHLSDINVGSNTVVTYGVFYIPFAIIIFLLWRFFATFMRSAY